MIRTVVQLWGGTFPVLSAAFDYDGKGRGWRPGILRTWPWIVNLIGVPIWVFIFVREHNWLAASVDLAGIPAIIFGLLEAGRGVSFHPKWFERAARITILSGVAMAAYDLGGAAPLARICELAIAAGFIAGIHLLRRKKRAGYFWFMLMNLGTAALLCLEGYPWVILQQIVSFGCVVRSLLTHRRKPVKLALVA